MDEADSEDERLFDEALDLVIRLQGDPRNAIAADTARRWRARGRAHEDAWRRALEVHALTGSVLAWPAIAAGSNRPISRRIVMAGAVTAAAAVSAGLVAGPELWRRARADYATGVGEVRSIALPDGSMATLGPGSALALAFAGERRVDLLAGMVFVDVMPDPARPFRVSSGAVVATALGTAFDLCRENDLVTVSVEHGRVGLTAGETAPAGAPLEAGQWAAMRTGASEVQRGTRALADIATWRSGTLVVDDEVIADVVARIARWQPGRVVMADPALGAERISGVFDLHDPAKALEAVVRPYGGHVRRLASILTVIAPF